MARRRKSRALREILSRRYDFAHVQRVVRRAESSATLIRLERRALLGYAKWTSIGNPPAGWSRFICALARSRGAQRLAEWWRHWLLTVDPKTCSVDDETYGTLHKGLGILSFGQSLLKHPTWSHELRAFGDAQREYVVQLRAYLLGAQELSEELRLFWPGHRKSVARGTPACNPLHKTITAALHMLEERASLFGYTKPPRLTIGRRGRAAADPRSAVRGYAVRGLAEYLAVAPSGVRESFIADVLESAGHGTVATRQNVQAILRAARKV